MNGFAKTLDGLCAASETAGEVKSAPDWIKVGAKVRFANPDYESWGEATIAELVKGGRIGVEVRKLFGRPTRVYVPASEIVPM